MYDLTINPNPLTTQAAPGVSPPDPAEAHQPAGGKGDVRAERIEAYETRRAERAQRLSNRAERARAVAAALTKRASERASCIPLGQPILIGHHSEIRDRNFRAGINRDFARAARLERFAADLAHSARSAATNSAISSDDPAATDKLGERIARLKEQRDLMKKTNAAWRRKGAEGLASIGLSAEQIEKIAATIERAYSWEKQPFPAWQVSNLTANIRRLEQRIPELEAKAAKAETEDETLMFCGVAIIRAHADNRLRLRFAGKPSASTIADLKRNGFRWSPTAGAWQRQISNAAEYAARSIITAATLASNQA